MSDVLYRIIDANFNRCREAFRVMEEYCRFGLNNPALSARAKQLRHELCGAIDKLDNEKLLSCRDTDGDVGKTTEVSGQLKRQSIEDCFTAAAKRAGEALRALAESAQSIDPEITAVAERLRFAAYALEKDVVLKASATRKFAPVRLYVLINATPDISPADTLELVDACIAGGADCLQLRAKGFTDKALLALAEKFTAACKGKNVISIINDRIDIAILSGADGVHLGQDEIPLSKARRLAKAPLIYGASTHNEQELRDAIQAGYDYIAIGPAFASPTKPDVPVAGPDYLHHALPVLTQAGIPHVAIGGITAHNIVILQKIGIRTIAVSSCICETESPHNSCKVLKDMLLNEKY